ncbi:MAG: NUDIX hydrolase [Patescibacteria group bacterium]
MKQIVFKVGVLVTKDNQLLLIKEKCKADTKYQWNIIKGTVEPEKDSDVFAAAQREVREEGGVDEVEITAIQSITFLNKEDKFFIQVNLLANTEQEPDENLRENVENEDIVDARFFSREELESMKEDDFLNERARLTIKEWLADKKYPKDIIQLLTDY